MISDRPYRKRLTTEQVMEEIKKHSGSQFDPVVVESALTLLRTESVGEQTASEQTNTQIRASQKLALQVQSG